jgi:hypothetical protein
VALATRNALALVKLWHGGRCFFAVDSRLAAIFGCATAHSTWGQWPPSAHLRSSRAEMRADKRGRSETGPLYLHPLSALRLRRLVRSESE